MRFTTDRTVEDSSGSQAWVFWIEDSYFPATYLVRGDSFEDAYNSFLCDPRVEEQIGVADDNYIGDYINGWHGPAPATMADLEAAWKDDATWITVNDNGVPLDTESAQGVSAETWGRRLAAAETR